MQRGRKLVRRLYVALCCVRDAAGLGLEAAIEELGAALREFDEPVALTSAKVCVGCGYLHPISGAAGPDRCERCEALLPAARTNSRSGPQQGTRVIRAKGTHHVTPFVQGAW